MVAGQAGPVNAAIKNSESRQAGAWPGFSRSQASGADESPITTFT
jgi:hypothetical protein